MCVEAHVVSTATGPATLLVTIAAEPQVFVCLSPRLGQAFEALGAAYGSGCCVDPAAGAEAQEQWGALPGSG